MLTKRSNEIKHTKQEHLEDIVSTIPSLISVINYAKDLIPGLAEANYRMAERFRDFVITKDLDTNSIVFDILYSRGDSYYEFGSPLFLDLEQKYPVPEIKYAQKPEEYTQKNKRTGSISISNFFSKIKNKFIDAFYNRRGIFGVSILLLAYTVMLGLVLGGTGVVGSTFLFFPLIPMIAFYVPIYCYLRKSALEKKLYNTFQKINQRNKDAKEALSNLGMFNNILLHPRFPNNREIRWSYYFLKSILNGFNPSDFVEVWELTKTPDERFHILSNFINTQYLWLDEAIHSHRVENKVLVIWYSDSIEAYIKDLTDCWDKNCEYFLLSTPINSEAHQNLAKELNTNLLDCVKSLSKGNFIDAREKLTKSGCGAYALRCYPAVAILYWQIEIILDVCMFNKDYIKKEIVPYPRLEFAKQNFLKINNYVEKYYPERLEEHEFYMRSFMDVIESLEHPEPEPDQNPLITPLAEIRLSGARHIDAEIIEDIDEPQSKPASLRNIV